MLMQYFTYDELQRLKLKVIEQHLVLKQLKEWGELQEAGRAYLTSKYNFLLSFGVLTCVLG